MGCCGSKELDSGEEHVRKILKDINLWDTTYSDLKNYLIRFSKDDKINKNILKKEILDPLVKCVEHTMIFEVILSKLDEYSNIYQTIFYLFPFLSICNEQNKYFFEVLFHMNNNVTLRLDQIRKFYMDYYEFVLISVTEQIREAVSKNEIINLKRDKTEDIDNLLKDVYNTQNIQKELDILMKILEKKGYGNSSQIKFEEIEDEKLLYAYTDLRYYFRFKYMSITTLIILKLLYDDG